MLNNIYEDKWVCKKIFNLIRYIGITLQLLQSKNITNPNENCQLKFIINEMYKRGSNFNTIYVYLMSILQTNLDNFNKLYDTNKAISIF